MDTTKILININGDQIDFHLLKVYSFNKKYFLDLKLKFYFSSWQLIVLKQVSRFGFLLQRYLPLYQEI